MQMSLSLRQSSKIKRLINFIVSVATFGTLEPHWVWKDVRKFGFVFNFAQIIVFQRVFKNWLRLK